MNYEFWKKAGIATGAIGTIAIASVVLASDAVPNANNNQNINQNRYMGMMGPRGAMSKMRGFQNNAEALKAIESRDYNAFVRAVTPENGQAPKILETIKAENFGKFCDMHDAMKNKDFETAKSIAEELGLSQPGERGPINSQQIHTPEERDAIHAAVIAGDYQAWFNLIAKDGKLPEHLQTITVDNFARFSEMHKLMDSAQSIREELGLKKPNQGLHGMGIGRGQHNSQGFGRR